MAIPCNVDTNISVIRSLDDPSVALVVDAIQQIRAENDGLRSEVAELRTKSSGLQYLGVWEPNDTYACGSAVTWGGSLFIARRDTAAKPGSDGDTGWTLAVKHGRDGRDAPSLRRPPSGTATPRGTTP